MPDKVLRWVAGLLAVCCVAGFAMGVASTPNRGRLPGEAATDAEGTAIAATEAKPLDTEELGPPRPPEPIAQEIDEDEKKPEPAPPPPAPKPVAPEVAPQSDPVGALLEPKPQAAPPPQEDPPF